MGEKRGSSSIDGLGSMGGRRNTLPPLSDLLELGHTELSKKGLPPTPPYSHFSFTSSTTPSNSNGGKNAGLFAHPPPAPSTGARINNYHHHPHPRPSTTQPLNYTRQRQESVDSDMSNGDRSLPKLERLRISPNSIRNSIVSSRSSTFSKGSERDSFYSFASEDGELDSSGMDQMMDAPHHHRTASYTPSPTSATDHTGPLIPSFTNRHQTKNLLSDATLPPILCTGTGLGFSSGLPSRPTRLPSLSVATNSNAGRPFEHMVDFSGLFDGAGSRGKYDSSKHGYVPNREKRNHA